jgi:hypothetical protein
MSAFGGKADMRRTFLNARGCRLLTLSGHAERRFDHFQRASLTRYDALLSEPWGWQCGDAISSV